MLLFGGIIYDLYYYQVFDDLKLFQFWDLKWVTVDPLCDTTFPCPEKRWGHSAVMTPLGMVWQHIGTLFVSNAIVAGYHRWEPE